MNLLSLLSARSSVSGEEIARMMNISRAAVHKKIMRLRKQGYSITGKRNMGYSLLSRPDKITREELLSVLPAGSMFAGGINFYENIPSTQAKARERADAGAPEGALILAERQSGAYGRLGRAWESPEKGIWFSLLLRPPLLPENIPQVTLLCSLAVCRAMENVCAVTTGIKWPNDVLIEKKKVAGILIEMSAEIGKVNWVIAGIGINANNDLPAELQPSAVSLNTVTGAPVNRAQLLASILAQFELLYTVFRKEGFAPFREEYNHRLTLLGKSVTLDCSGQTFTGHVDSVTDEGHLRLNGDDGKTHNIIAGDVSLHGKLNGY